MAISLLLGGARAHPETECRSAAIPLLLTPSTAARHDYELAELEQQASILSALEDKLVLGGSVGSNASAALA